MKLTAVLCFSCYKHPCAKVLFLWVVFFRFVYLYSGVCRTGIILMYMISLVEKLVQEFDFFFFVIVAIF